MFCGCCCKWCFLLVSIVVVVGTVIFVVVAMGVFLVLAVPVVNFSTLSWLIVQGRSPVHLGDVRYSKESAEILFHSKSFLYQLVFVKDEDNCCTLMYTIKFA
jgi:hypothetical protein